MDALPRFEEVAALGRQLVDELGEDPPPDTLSGWMAHYVAELIDAAANAPVWQARCVAPEVFRNDSGVCGATEPTCRAAGGLSRNLEPIARALESLDPNNQRPRFFTSVRRGAADKEEGSQVLSQLEFVDGVDFTARIIIVHALADAARSALDKSREWVALAEAAGRNPPFVGIVTLFHFEEKDEPTTTGNRSNANESCLLTALRNSRDSRNWRRSLPMTSRGGWRDWRRSRSPRQTLEVMILRTRRGRSRVRGPGLRRTRRE